MDKGQKHRLMLHKLSQTLSTSNCADLGRFYELPASFFDDIEKGSPGVKLISALEQRRIICDDDLTILKAFYDILNEYNLGKAAKIVSDCYPTLVTVNDSDSSRRGETTESGAPVTYVSHSKNF